ncbi:MULTISPECIES: acyl-CoA dehydrogenase family protein [Mycetohabitans]|uniref:Acyl-CoA dehydrogenase n=1 Tax=Mycetohabitans endofungorum TaxID=417203 RepID=A0A2P5KAD7_9BURK|nr:MULTISPECIES: acyl-CoA dehydrogenase family protein [Mycetohabitans]PPB83678.1 acyl-CoA dehydrogenase [Mycetohabitans endofungorum]
MSAIQSANSGEPVHAIALPEPDARPSGAGEHALDQAAIAVAQVAARFADAVDREARFPSEAIDAMREHRLLGAMAPVELGGMGASLEAVASACRILGHACSSAAMIYAMHQIEVICVLEHAMSVPWHRGFLRQVAEHEWLLASATSEDSVGGNLRNSRCAIEPDGDGAFTLHKLAPTISYGAYADAILATARRSPDAPAVEQVLVTILKDDTTLTRRSGWDTFGMRGTCSEGFVLESRGRQEQVFPVPFGEIAERTMVPASHILWSSLWTGIASDAFSRAHRYFRTQAQDKPTGASPAGSRIAEALGLLQAMQGRIDSALRVHARASASATRSWSETMADAAQINTLKTYVSITALQVVMHAVMICGMAAYKNGTPFTLSRHIRDLYSAPLMINNDRIDANTASLLLAQRPASLEKE